MSTLYIFAVLFDANSIFLRNVHVHMKIENNASE